MVQEIVGYRNLHTVPAMYVKGETNALIDFNFLRLWDDIKDAILATCSRANRDLMEVQLALGKTHATRYILQNIQWLVTALLV